MEQSDSADAERSTSGRKPRRVSKPKRFEDTVVDFEEVDVPNTVSLKRAMIMAEKSRQKPRREPGKANVTEFYSDHSRSTTETDSSDSSTTDSDPPPVKKRKQNVPLTPDQVNAKKRELKMDKLKKLKQNKLEELAKKVAEKKIKKKKNITPKSTSVVKKQPSPLSSTVSALPTPIMTVREPLSPPPQVLSSLPTKSNRPKPVGRPPKNAPRPPVEKPSKWPVSSFSLWGKFMKAKLTMENPDLDVDEIGNKLGDVWVNIPEKEKLFWKKKVAALQKEEAKAQKLGGMGKRAISAMRPPLLDIETLAAHLKLVGDSLKIVGSRLNNYQGTIEGGGSLSVILDSFLCTLTPLLCLTNHVDGLDSIPKETLQKSLDNVAYFMPGL